MNQALVEQVEAKYEEITSMTPCEMLERANYVSTDGWHYFVNLSDGNLRIYIDLMDERISGFYEKESYELKLPPDFCQEARTLAYDFCDF